MSRPFRYTFILVLVALGAIASRLAKAFKARRAAAAGEVGESAKGVAEKSSGDGGEKPAGADRPSAAGGQHGIGDSNPGRAGELVKEEAAKGAKPAPVSERQAVRLEHRSR